MRANIVAMFIDEAIKSINKSSYGLVVRVVESEAVDRALNGKAINSFDSLVSSHLTRFF